MPANDEERDPFIDGQGGGERSKKKKKQEAGALTVLMTRLWFGSACCVFLGGVLGLVTLVSTAFDPPGCLDEVYLVLFGFLMMLHESPVDVGPLGEIKDGIAHQAMFLTRIIGRGAFFTFLGTMTFFTTAENVSIFVALTLGLFVILVGMLSIVYGHAKTRQLERVRYRIYLETQNAADVRSLYDEYANADTDKGTRVARGLTKDEFNKIADFVMKQPSATLQGRRVTADKNWTSFDSNSLNWIFAAIVSNPEKEYLSAIDLDVWCRGSWTLL